MKRTAKTKGGKTKAKRSSSKKRHPSPAKSPVRTTRSDEHSSQDEDEWDDEPATAPAPSPSPSPTNSASHGGDDSPRTMEELRREVAELKALLQEKEDMKAMVAQHIDEQVRRAMAAWQATPRSETKTEHADQVDLVTPPSGDSSATSSIPPAQPGARQAPSPSDSDVSAAGAATNSVPLKSTTSAQRTQATQPRASRGAAPQAPSGPGNTPSTPGGPADGQPPTASAAAHGAAPSTLAASTPVYGNAASLAPTVPAAPGISTISNNQFLPYAPPPVYQGHGSGAAAAANPPAPATQPANAAFLDPVLDPGATWKTTELSPRDVLYRLDFEKESTPFSVVNHWLNRLDQCVAVQPTLTVPQLIASQTSATKAYLQNTYYELTGGSFQTVAPRTFAIFLRRHCERVSRRRQEKLILEVAALKPRTGESALGYNYRAWRCINTAMNEGVAASSLGAFITNAVGITPYSPLRTYLLTFGVEDTARTNPHDAMRTWRGTLDRWKRCPTPSRRRATSPSSEHNQQQDKPKAARRQRRQQPTSSDSQDETTRASPWRKACRLHQSDDHSTHECPQLRGRCYNCFGSDHLSAACPNQERQYANEVLTAPAKPSSDNTRTGLVAKLALPPSTPPQHRREPLTEPQPANVSSMRTLDSGTPQLTEEECDVPRLDPADYTPAAGVYGCVVGWKPVAVEGVVLLDSCSEWGLISRNTAALTGTVDTSQLTDVTISTAGCGTHVRGAVLVDLELQSIEGEVIVLRGYMAVVDRLPPGVCAVVSARAVQEAGKLWRGEDGIHFGDRVFAEAAVGGSLVELPREKSSRRPCHSLPAEPAPQPSAPATPTPAMVTATTASPAGDASPTPPRWDHDSASQHLQRKHPHVFSNVGSLDIGYVKFDTVPGEPMVIDTGDHPGVARAAYRYNPRKQRVVRAHVYGWLLNGVCERLNGPTNWRAPAFLVAKKTDGDTNATPAPADSAAQRKEDQQLWEDCEFLLDHQQDREKHNALLLSVKERLQRMTEGTRCVVDYTGLNAVTVPDYYAIVPADDLIASVCLAGDDVVFSVLDISSAYNCIPIHPESRLKTAFSYGVGMAQFLRVPFGLRNASGNLARMLSRAMAPLVGVHVFVFYDDVLVVSPRQTHLKILEQICQVAEDWGFKYKASKCRFFQEHVRYLGYVLSREGISPDPEKVAAIREWPRPRNAADVRRFCGLLNFYRDLIPDVAEKLRPLHELTKKGAAFNFDGAASEAFEWAKSVLMSDTVLALPRWGEKFYVSADASDYAIGGVLEQKFEGVFRPIRYFSRTLKEAECNYTVTEKELLAIVDTLIACRRYLAGHPLEIRTDHKALLWVVEKDVSKFMLSRLHRWRSVLNNFSYTLKHTPGELNVVADTLSRPPSAEHSVVVPVTTVAAAPQHHALLSPAVPVPVHHPLFLPRVKAAQRGDPECQALIAAAADSGKPQRVAGRVMAHLDGESGVLVVTPHAPGAAPRPLVPESLRAEVMRYAHDVLTGHRGASDTLQAITDYFWFPKVRERVDNFVRGCPTCQRRKPSQITRHGTMGTWYAVEPLHTVHIDHVAMPPVDGSPTYLLTARDRFTRWLVAVPVADETAETAITAFYRHWMCTLGTPARVYSDNGPAFASGTFALFLQAFGIEHTTTAPYHPQANGMVERSHRAIKDALALHAANNDDTFNWPRYLPHVVATINQTACRSIGMSPYEALFGVPPRSRLDERTGEGDNQLRRLHHRLASARHQARKAVHAQQRKVAQANARAYDRTHTPATFAVNDAVAVRVHVREHTLSDRWEGPYRVVAAHGKGCYTVYMPHGQTMAEKRVNVAHLRKWHFQEDSHLEVPAPQGWFRDHPAAPYDIIDTPAGTGAGPTDNAASPAVQPDSNDSPDPPTPAAAPAPAAPAAATTTEASPPSPAARPVGEPAPAAPEAAGPAAATTRPRRTAARLARDRLLATELESRQLDHQLRPAAARQRTFLFGGDPTAPDDLHILGQEDDDVFEP